MGFYIRKSIKAGPFRFNLSKSGLGLSVGVRGLRFGTGPKGNFVHAGVGGFYYRSSIGKKPNNTRQTKTVETTQNAPPIRRFDNSGIELIEIESGDVQFMRDSKAEDIVADIAEKNGRTRKSKLFGGISTLLAALLALAVPQTLLATLPLTLVMFVFGQWLDSFQRVSVIMYNFDEHILDRYKKLIVAFENLSRCSAIWHIPEGGAVKTLTQWKRNAGAAYVMSRKTIVLKTGLPNVVRCNLDVPIVPVGRQKLYLFPDFVLVVDGNKVGGVGYSELLVRVQNSNFIEEDRPPSDTKILSHTWKHPNKSGGPDRRFRDNRQLPICEYESILFESRSGVKELVQVSRAGFGNTFRKALVQLGLDNSSPTSENLLG